MSGTPTAAPRPRVGEDGWWLDQGLARLAFGTRQGTGGTSTEHLAYLPNEALELDLADPAQREFGDYELLEQIGPLTGTSANRSDHPPLCTADAVAAELGPDVDLILDAGPTPGGAPSTVIDARSPVRILREGAVSRADLAGRLHRAGFALSP